MNLIGVLLVNYCFIITLSTASEKSTVQDFQSNGIELIITNIRNNKGLIQIGMYESDKGYPDKPEVSFSLSKDSLVSGKLKFFIPLKKKGTFAFSILDDENRNEKMDYRLGIIPKEGFGFSNNPKIRGMKEPPFEVTSFQYTGGREIVTVKMIYML